MADVIVRTATIGDAPAMAEVDRQSWPPALATTAAEFVARMEAYADGQLAAVFDGRVVGSAAAQRVTEEFLADNQSSYEPLTDHNRFTHSHTPSGEIYQLIGVGVVPSFRGRQLGRQLVDFQLNFARSLAGVRRIVGFTRPAGYAQHVAVPIEEYVRRRGNDGRLLDPVLAFHVDAGAQIVSIHKGFRPADDDACGYGVLIEYPLG